MATPKRPTLSSSWSQDIFDDMRALRDNRIRQRNIDRYVEKYKTQHSLCTLSIILLTVLYLPIGMIFAIPMFAWWVLIGGIPYEWGGDEYIYCMQLMAFLPYTLYNKHILKKMKIKIEE